MDTELDFGGEIVWRPGKDEVQNANLTQFMRQYHISDFDTLVHLSSEDPAWFTDALLKFLKIEFYRPYTQVLNLEKGVAWPQWCVNGQMNIIHNCLDKYMLTPQSKKLALIAETENGDILTLTYAQLFEKVNQTANALRSFGLGKGDAIGLFMPMTPEIVIAFLAIAKIGGIILPMFSGFGAGALATRMADVEAKALITADGFYRRGKLIRMKPIADEAALSVPSLQKMVVLNRTGTKTQMLAGRDVWWKETIEIQPKEAPTTITDAEDILMIIYTSGTTGRPKGAVHTHCGFPIKAAQDMAFGTDLHPGQVIHWITDMGWMMGPWMVFGTLLLGGTMLLYDGAPDYPQPDRIWSLVEKHQIAILGLSPTFVRALIPHGYSIIQQHNLSSLRLFASTGEPWNPDPWMWLYEKVGQGRLPIINYSGGTEISGGIVMGNPILPLKPCAFSGVCPGIAADVFDEKGRSIRNHVGELVIKAPWIGMTRGFWRDPQRYLDAYWSTWEGIWVHGDFAAVDEDGMWYIFGRSDDTIKVAGKRVGPAEIESILINHPKVLETAVIGIPDEIKGNEIIAFTVLMPNIRPDDRLPSELMNMVAETLGKPFMPKEILFVHDLPKTRNAKVMRRMIRAAYLGQEAGDTSSLVNPEVIDEIRQLRQAD